MRLLSDRVGFPDADTPPRHAGPRLSLPTGPPIPKYPHRRARFSAAEGRGATDGSRPA